MASDKELFGRCKWYWEDVGGPAGVGDVAAAIAMAESHGNPTATLNTVYKGRSDYQPPPRGASVEFSVGLWQINLLAHPQYHEQEMRDPLLCAKAAIQISSHGRDFHAWSTYDNPSPDSPFRTYLRLYGGDPTAVPPVPPSQPKLDASNLLGGWNQLTGVLARSLPSELHRSKRYRRATMHALAHRHRHR